MQDISLEDLMAGFDPQAALSAAASSFKGREQPLSAQVSGFLSKEQVEEVGSKAVGINTTPQIKKLRNSHHRLAQLLAKGEKEVVISAITGYSLSRISILKHDPAFADLIAQYKEHVNLEFADTVSKMKDVADDALDIIHERLQDSPETFTNNGLIEVIKNIGDRAGFAPVQKSIHTSVNVSGEDITAIKNAVKERATGHVKQIVQESIAGEYTILSGAEKSPVGHAD